MKKRHLIRSLALLSICATLSGRAGTIRGTVTNADGGLPLEGIDVQAFHTNTVGAWVMADMAWTAADGTYEINDLPEDTFRVMFARWNNDYVFQTYNGHVAVLPRSVIDWNVDDDILVTSGGTVSNIDAALTAGGRIRGTVTDANSTLPLQTIEVLAYRENVNGGWDWAGRRLTAADGTYNIGGLPDGTYRVSFAENDGTYGVQTYNGHNGVPTDGGDDIIVTLSATVENINAALTDGDPDPALSISPETRSHTQDAASGQTIDVTANVAWTATRPADQSWITITSGSSGSGDGTVTYSVSANTTTSARNGTITVSGGGLTRTFELDQSGAELDDTVATPTFNPDGGAHSGTNVNVVVSCATAGATIRFTSEAGTTPGADPTILSEVVPTNGIVSVPVPGWLKAQAWNDGMNPSEVKSAVYTAAGSGGGGGGGGGVVDPDPALSISPTTRSHTQDAASGQTISVTANVAWTATRPAAQSWITITSGSAGSGNGTVTYSVSTNTTTSSRTGTITVSGSGITRTFAVTQSGAEAEDPLLSISPATRSHTQDAASGQTIGVTANVAWTATRPAAQSWITITSGHTGTGDGTVHYSIGENTSTSPRSATITISGGEITQTFAITQSGATTDPGDGMSPDGGTTITDRRPQFSWPVVSGATWYQLWILRGGQMYVTPWIQGATTWTPPVNGLPGGSYRWWVRGWGPQMGYGAWSGAANFSVVAGTPGTLTLTAPTGAEEGHDLTFRWNRDERATWYRLWVSHPQGGSWHDRWYAMSGTGEGTATVNGHPGGTSTWWMQPWGPDGTGPWTGPRSFSTPDPAPAVPTLVSPVGATTSPVSLQYESERTEWFRVYVMRGGTVVLDRWTEDATFNLGARPSGNYTWWVGAWNAATRRTVWSERGNFLIP